VAPLAVLLVRSGGLAGQRLTIRHAASTVGSGTRADLPLADPSVGALHARIELRQGIWTLAVLGSEHSVKVDGEVITGEVPLSPGSTIHLGEVALLFEPRDQTDPARSRRDPGDPAGEPVRRRSGWGIGLAVLLGILLLLGGIALELTR
jgi:pSer/pThr/pTyr-binding forkhead associated (FHA) protein